MSTHKCPVVPINLEIHPKADSLSIVKVNEFTYVAKTADWQNVPLGVWIEPDYVVPSNRPEFEWLKDIYKEIENNGVKGYRIRVKRLRGVMSMGLMIPAPEGAKIGDDYREHYGIVRYEPPEPMSTGGEATKPPAGFRPVYDIEGARNFVHLFTDGEEVVVTEKVHGCNARFAFVDGAMFCGSRTEWKREEEGNLWWKALASTPAVAEFCKANPDITVYGEVYGQVKNFHYGLPTGKIGIIVFDLLRHGNWVDYDEAKALGKSLPWVPELFRGPWNKEALFALAEGKTTFKNATHIREGLVVKPVKERTNLEIGRTQLKIVSNTFFEKDD